MTAPLFVLLFGPVRSGAIIVLMEIVVTARLFPGAHREIRWKLIAPMGLATALLTPSGSWLLVTVDPDLIDRASLIAAALLLPVFMAGAFMGSRLLRKSNETLYRRVALTLVFCVGCYRRPFGQKDHFGPQSSSTSWRLA